MKQPLILIVDDEPTVREVVRKYLERDGYKVAEAADGPAALSYLQNHQPELIVLDVMLPGIDGMAITRKLRDPGNTSLSANIPIIMLTAKREEMQRIHGLEVGADDYVTKPFSPQELTARVKAVLRRTTPMSEVEKPLQFTDIQIDPRTRSVVIKGVQPPELTAKEFDLLWFLARHPAQVFTRTQLLDQVWGLDYYGEDSTVTVHIRRLREKIEPDPSDPTYVKTVWGVGYKFDE